MSKKIYYFKDNKKIISIKAENEEDAWRKVIKKLYNYNNLDDYFEYINYNLNKTPTLLNSEYCLKCNKIKISILCKNNKD